MELSEEYVLNAIFTYAGSPERNRFDGNYNCGCPICREGKSWGKKKRLFYYPKTKSFFCFNCSESWTAKKWVHEVSGLSYTEMLSEGGQEDISIDILLNKPLKKVNLPSLPSDSVNISDETQISYYKKNKWVRKALSYIEKRRLNTAINAPKKFYMSLTDYTHKNRLVIPFWDNAGHISFYQTRSLDGSNPRYLGKYGSDKTIFGIEKVDPKFEYIFLFEGAIDSCFVKNGVGLAGLTLSKKQEIQLAEFPFHQKIWVLDNISVTKDDETKNKTIKLLNDGEKIFKWSNHHKDLNDWCIQDQIDHIDPETIIQNLY